MSTEEDQSSEDQSSKKKSIEIPDDAQIITQVQWAWLWSGMPWLIILMALYLIGFIPDEISTIIIALVILIPRYLIWRRTALAITDDGLIYQRGGVIGSQQYEVPVDNITDVRARHGFFGRSLGYEAVDIMLDNGAVATLAYVPTLANLADKLGGLTGKSFDDDDDDDEPEDVEEAAPEPDSN